MPHGYFRRRSRRRKHRPSHARPLRARRRRPELTRCTDSMDTWFNDGKRNGLYPKLFARSAVEAMQVSLLVRVFRTSDKDAAMRNDGAAVTRPWDCRLPADVIRRPPMERRFVLLSDTIPTRPTKLRPMPCPRCQGQQQGQRSSSLKKIDDSCSRRGARI
ncbi:MAG: hypothetical protein JWM99_5226 [Verrucomicrobiales bacterium]|nr:hypothetical protein [Verrucomicrobiales bacterium]